jgi:hypothetical protein
MTPLPLRPRRASDSFSNVNENCFLNPWPFFATDVVVIIRASSPFYNTREKDVYLVAKDCDLALIWLMALWATPNSLIALAFLINERLFSRQMFVIFCTIPVRLQYRYDIRPL